MKPVLITAKTQSIPRWRLLTFVALYALIGIIGREPWKGFDAIAFGAMKQMVHGSWLDWLTPNISGFILVDTSPLGLWIGALSMQLFGAWLGEVLAGRLPSLLYLALACFALWRWTFRLSLDRSAQPYALPYGGQPSADGYARMSADCAVLLFLGSLGLLVPAHSAGNEALLTALIACVGALSVTALSRRYCLLLGVVLGLLTLSSHFIVLAALFSVVLIVNAQQPAVRARLWRYSAPVALLLPLLWLLAIAWVSPFQYVGFWWHGRHTWFGISGLESARQINASLLFTLPALPFALWALWRWRKTWYVPHIFVPSLFFVGLLLVAIVWPTTSINPWMLFLPSMALLASFGLSQMSRDTISAIDWFALIMGSLVAIFIWLMWCALWLGWPAGLAAELNALSPSYRFDFQWLPFVVALAASVLWVLLAYWRIARRPKVLWRTVVLSIGAVILNWLLLMTVWLKPVDDAKSYQALAQSFAAQLPPEAHCINSMNLGLEQRALLYFYTAAALSSYTQITCNYLLIQSNQVFIEPPDEHWRLQWRGQRSADKAEFFHLFRRYTPQ